MNTNEKKKIAILGSTGSIGTQALQVIEEHADLYEAYVLTANNRVELLIEQARRFMPEAVVIANEDKYEVLRDALADLPIKVYAGAEALCQIVQERPVDVVLIDSLPLFVFIEDGATFHDILSVSKYIHSGKYDHISGMSSFDKGTDKVKIRTVEVFPVLLLCGIFAGI